MITRDDRHEIAIVEEYDREKPRSKMREVAGLYITEDRIDCVIGALYDFDERFGVNVVQIMDLLPGSHTHNDEKHQRKHVSIERKGANAQELISSCVDWLAEQSINLVGIAIGCFGPFVSLSSRPLKLELGETTDYGQLAELPNYPVWSRVALYAEFYHLLSAKGLSPEIRVYTDVDAAACGEYWFLARGKNEFAQYVRDKSVVFLKFSRSVSAGVAYRGEPWQGRLHLTAGAVQPPRYRFSQNGVTTVDNYIGCCPYHKNCIEGLIGQTALEERAKRKLTDISRDSDNDQFWDMVAYYIAHLCVITSSFIAPSRIVIGGRIIGENQDLPAAERLLGRVRGYFYRYVEADAFGNWKGRTSPSYPELTDTANFITLPARPRLKNGERRWAMPGRHGLLRLAAQKAYRR